MNLKLVIFLVVILCLRFFFFYQNRQEFSNGQQVSFDTILFSEPQVVSSKQSFTADLASNRVRIIAPSFPRYNYGQELKISGTLDIKLIDTGTLYSLYYPKIEIIKDPSYPLQNGLLIIGNIRQRLVSLFSTTLPSPSAGLLMGIIFGIKEAMPQNFMDNLRVAGVLHVIAASGMNVTLIGGFISSFLAFFLKRQIALFVSIFAIIFYVILGGAEASLIRAAIMGVLVFSAQILGRQSLAINGLFLAAFIMLFIKPILVFDIGFQLSFAATLGILYIKPFIEKRWGIDSEILTTLAAQIATLPILLANFGQYSIYSVLVNALVLWTIPFVMVAGGIGALVGLVIQPLGRVIIYLSYPLLLYFEFVVNFFGKIGGLISIDNFPWQLSVGYYLLVASLLIFLRKTNK